MCALVALFVGSEEVSSPEFGMYGHVHTIPQPSKSIDFKM